MISKALKQEVISQFRKSDNDTGSSQVQIGVITQRIKEIAEHLKVNPKDNHSRLGLVKLVGKRKTFLNYLKRTDKDAYKEMMLKIKRQK